MIIGIGEEVKGYRVYLPKDKKVVTSQHVRNIETLNKTQNLQVQRLNQVEEAEAEEESREQGSGAADRSSTGNESERRGKGGKKSSKKKKAWTRERHVTRSVARAAEAESTEAEQQDTSAGNIVNNVLERDPRNYKEAMHSQYKVAWMEAMVEELKALEGNGVWEVVRLPKNVNVLHTKKWRVPAKHGDVPNAYVKADKEEDLRIYIRVPQGMKIPKEILKELGVETDAEVALELKKALYGLKQAGRRWSKLLHSKLVEIGLHQSLVDMCVYYRYKDGVLIVVGVYVDDLLVTGIQQHAVDVFFEELKSLDIKDLGCAHMFLGMRIEYSDDNGWNEVAKAAYEGDGGVDRSLDVVGYSDADYAADKADRKSTTGGLVPVDGMAVSWICKKQGGVSFSTMEAEYTAASVVARELLGVRELLGEMQVSHEMSMKLCADNQAALKQLGGEQSSGKAKHIDVRIKFVGDFVRRGVVRAEYLETKEIPVDVLTKALLRRRLREKMLYCEPDLVVCFNTGIWGYDEWLPATRLVLNKVCVLLLVTSYNEHEAEDDEDALS
ncbi:Integrase catalytic core protein [Phytophthora cinnamomi]|uniref:Integrase catalytic core protein n=1 Tax=Phytophthora cinnamomi TaxID=4785 RepID=UPI00355A5E00|nr:Integrase catalytic core protein [Phytophthora cinnamomi]